MLVNLHENKAYIRRHGNDYFSVGGAKIGENIKTIKTLLN